MYESLFKNIGGRDGDFVGGKERNSRTNLSKMFTLGTRGTVVRCPFCLLPLKDNRGVEEWNYRGRDYVFR